MLEPFPMTCQSFSNFHLDHDPGTAVLKRSEVSTLSRIHHRARFVSVSM